MTFQIFISMVKEWVQAQGYLQTSFVDRGDPAAADMRVGDFAKDGSWHTLDLSGIVPAGAKAIVFYLGIRCNYVDKKAYFRMFGNTYTYNYSAVRQTVGGVIMQQDLICPVDENRRIEYKIESSIWTTLTFTVKGWWF